MMNSNQQERLKQPPMEVPSTSIKRHLKIINAGSGNHTWKTRKINGGMGSNGWSETSASELGVVRSLRSKEKDKNGMRRDEMTTAGPGGESRNRWVRTRATPFDRGSNSIAKIKQENQNWVTNEMNKGDLKGIVLDLKGHSRGAVATALSILDISEKYSDLQINAVLFDPVPSKTNDDLVEHAYGEVTLPSTVNSTVVYAANSNTFGYMAPQTVLGSRRIILTKRDHVATTTGIYLYGRTTHKGSQLNDLPPGVYTDHKSAKHKLDVAVLHKVSTMEEYRRNHGEARRNAPGQVGDEGRLEKIMNAVESTLNRLLNDDTQPSTYTEPTAHERAPSEYSEDVYD